MSDYAILGRYWKHQGKLDHLKVEHGSLLTHQLPVRSSGFHQINHVKMCFGLWCCVVKSVER